MKIQKIALSLLAIAISSSAFASAPSSNIQSISDKINHAFLDGQPIYEIFIAAASENNFGDARGSESSNIEFTSAQKEFIIKEIVLPMRTEVCEQSFRALRNGDSDVVRFNNLPVDALNISEKSLVAIKASSLLASCSFINPDTHKIEVLGLQDDESSSVWGYEAKVASGLKEKENAKAISEFNVLQQLAVNESDPAVKALIKQAADLKLAGYKK